MLSDRPAPGRARPARPRAQHHGHALMQLRAQFVRLRRRDRPRSIRASLYQASNIDSGGHLSAAETTQKSNLFSQHRCGSQIGSHEAGRILWRATAKPLSSHRIFLSTWPVRLPLTPTNHSRMLPLSAVVRPASPSRPNGCRRGFRELNTAGGGTTIFAARFSQPWLWRTRRSLIAGLSLPGLWRARRSADASARGDSGPARHHHGLATRVLELAQTRLGLGGPSLRLPPVPTRALDSCSLEPTIRRLGLGVRALAMKLATERSSC
jgi:hypothetical protein